MLKKWIIKVVQCLELMAHTFNCFRVHFRREIKGKKIKHVIGLFLRIEWKGNEGQRENDL